jgi:hypothetical protein
MATSSYEIVLRNDKRDMSFSKTFFLLTKDEVVTRAKGLLQTMGSDWKVIVYEKQSSCVYSSAIDF